MCIMYQLVEPLTGKTWSLSDFDGHPALLVSPPFLLPISPRLLLFPSFSLPTLSPTPLPPPTLTATRPSSPIPPPCEHRASQVMFICNHCPFVVHIKSQLVALGNEYISKHGLAVVAISSNSVLTHPQDGPDKMAEEAKQFNFPFPYLYDETQEVAKTYHAACTPDFFLFKKDGRRPFELAYHGQLDDSRPNNGRPVTGKDLRAALDCVLSARPVPSAQRPSIGCNIKWAPGNEPDYFG
ncbi:unnamed protein product [Closterium sp. NIES-65]|nr:unnamed protein product [Closterium sp. NIES-65]